LRIQGTLDLVEKMKRMPRWKNTFLTIATI